MPRENLGVDIHASVRSWRLAYAHKVLKKIHSIGADLIHLQYPTIAYGTGLLPHSLIFSKIPLIVTIHEASYAHILRRISLYAFLIFAKRIIATTPFEAKFLSAMYPLVQEKLIVVPIGSNIPLGPMCTRDSDVIMYFGLIAPKKGLEDFLDLAALAQKANKSWRFWIVGAVSSKWRKYAQELRKNAACLPVEWHLNLSAEAVANYLASAKAVYLPFPDGASLRRGSLIAALVNGVPIITTHGKATPPDLEEGKEVLFASSPQSALKKIERLVSDTELSSKLSYKATRYGEKFCWTRIAEQHINLYEHIRTAST